MVEVVRTDEFATWLEKLKDLSGKGRILRRLDRLAQGNPGDVRPIGKDSRNCDSTSARATGSTTCKTATP
jgi:putative addiction module killer protein